MPKRKAVPILAELVEKIPTKEELEQLLNNALTEPDKAKKGYLFELFFENLMAKEEGFTKIYKHSRSRLGEVDYVFRNEIKDSFWQISPYVCVECKNWEKKISSREMNHFLNLIKDKSPLSCFGVFITTSSYEDSAKTSINNARIGDNILIVPVEKKHLKELIEYGFKDYIRKLCEETIFKRA